MPGTCFRTPPRSRIRPIWPRQVADFVPQTDNLCQFATDHETPQPPERPAFGRRRTASCRPSVGHDRPGCYDSSAWRRTHENNVSCGSCCVPPSSPLLRRHHKTHSAPTRFSSVRFRRCCRRELNWPCSKAIRWAPPEISRYVSKCLTATVSRPIGIPSARTRL